MRQHVNIYDTSIYSISGIASQLENIARFLINNRDVRIVTPDVNEILKTKVLSTTPISTLYDNIVQNKKVDKNFVFLNIPSNLSVPEMLTMGHILIDVNQLQEYNNKVYKAISVLPEFKDKIIINITNLLRQKTKNSITDMNDFQNLVIRAALVKSYAQSQGMWLTPAMIKYLGKSYSMTVSSNIAKNYDLTINDQLLIATILTAYFHRMCIAANKEDEFPATILDCEYLGSRFDIVDRLETIKEKNNNSATLNINKVCELIAQLGPSRTETFNIRGFYTANQRLGQDHLSTLLSLEYPPYWTHQILMTLSGIKSGLYFALKRQNRLVNEGKAFADILNRSNLFVPAL